MALAVIDDISTRASWIIYDDVGGRVEYTANEPLMTLDIPEASIGDDIVVYITEVTFKEHLVAIAESQGLFLINGKMYDIRAVRVSDGTRVGTIDDPFEGPVIITFEVSPDAESPVISWLDHEMGLWEEIKTVRADDTHVAVEVLLDKKYDLYEAFIS